MPAHSHPLPGIAERDLDEEQEEVQEDAIAQRHLRRPVRIERGNNHGEGDGEANEIERR